MACSMRSALCSMLLRLPHAIVAVRKPAISMSCKRVYRRGICMGSEAMNSGLSYCSAFASKKAFNSLWESLVIDDDPVLHHQFTVGHLGQFMVVGNDDKGLTELVP